LLACSKKAPPPPAVVDATAPAPPPPAAPSPAARPPSCDPAETRIADVHVVTGWRAAYAKVAGFEATEPPSVEADAKNTLCRRDACVEAPPWTVTATISPHPVPTNLITPVSGKRLAVLRVGLTGADLCEGTKEPVHRIVSDPSVTDEVIVYDEEVTPLRQGEDGCEQAGPPTHRWHAVDTRTRKEWLFRGDVTVAVEGREIVAKKAGCKEIRYSR
jgi:hypothetical protein